MSLVDPALAGLFVNAFLAATLVPVASEPLALGLLAAGRDPWALWAVASAGNTLGAVVGWWLGRSLARFRDRPWFPVGPRALARAEAWFARFGRPALLLSWLPVVGDALTVIAGALRTPLALFVLLVGVGKAARYAVLLLPVAVWLRG